MSIPTNQRARDELVRILSQYDHPNYGLESASATSSLVRIGLMAATRVAKRAELQSAASRAAAIANEAISLPGWSGLQWRLSKVAWVNVRMLTGVPAVYVRAKYAPRSEDRRMLRDEIIVGDYAISYVGQAVNAFTRQIEHARDRRFQGYRIDTLLVLVEPSERAREDIEKDIIEYLNPPLNRQHRTDI